MVSPLELLNQASYQGARRGVTYMPALRAAPRRQGPPVTPRLAPQQQYGQGGGDWVTPNFDAIRSYAPPAQTQQGGGNALGGLGFVIGGAGKIAMGALDVLDAGRRASILGQEMAAKVLPDELEWLSPPSMLINESRDEDRSVMERFRDPSYGWGQVAKQIDTGHGDLDKWLNRGAGLAGDVALDPLTYLTFGVGAIPGKTGRSLELAKLLEAQRAARAGEESATALRGLGFLDDAIMGAAPRAAANPVATGLESTLPRIDALRSLGYSDDAIKQFAPELLEQSSRASAFEALGGVSQVGPQAFPGIPQALRDAEALRPLLGTSEDLTRLGQIGVSAATPDQLAQMGLRQHSVRFMGKEIPGTEGLSRAMSVPAQKLRPVARAVPGARYLREGASREGYFNQPLHNAYERVITGRGGSTIESALESIDFNEAARQAGGTFEGLANRELRILNNKLKGMADSERAQLIHDAERGADNIFSQYAAKVREAARFAGGQVPELKPITLADGSIRQYAMPHSLSRSFRDYLQGAAKGKYKLDEAAEAFKGEARITTKDLLAEGGFLNERRFVPNADGTPQEFKFGDRTITIEEGTVDELNTKFKELFPEFEGEIYETDPVTAWRRYIQATRKDVANQAASKRGARLGFEGYSIDPGAPARFDPYSGREQVTTRQADVGGTEVPVMRPVKTTEKPMTREQAEFYKMVPDLEATKGRNAAILKDPDLKRSQEFLAEEGKTRRTKLATSIDELAKEAHDPIVEERLRLEAAQEVGKKEAEKAVAAYNATVARATEIPAEAKKLDRQISIIDRKIRRVGRTTGKNITAKTEALRAELAVKRQALIEERDTLIALFKEDLATADTTNLMSAENIKDYSVRAVRTHTKELEDARDKARLAVESVRARAMSNTPGVLQPEQLRHYEGIIQAASPELREGYRNARGLRSLQRVKADTVTQLGEAKTAEAQAGKAIADINLDTASDEEVTRLMTNLQEARSSVKLLGEEVKAVEEQIKKQGKDALESGEVVRSRAQDDFDEAVRKLDRHRSLVSGDGGIEEGLQELTAVQRAAEQKWAEWQLALQSYAPPAPVVKPPAELNAAQRKAQRFLDTKQAKEYEAKVARLEAIDKEAASWSVSPEDVARLEAREKELAAIVDSTPEPAAVKPGKLAWTQENPDTFTTTDAFGRKYTIEKSDKGWNLLIPDTGEVKQFKSMQAAKRATKPIADVAPPVAEAVPPPAAAAQPTSIAGKIEAAAAKGSATPPGALGEWKTLGPGHYTYGEYKIDKVNGLYEVTNQSGDVGVFTTVNEARDAIVVHSGGKLSIGQAVRDPETGAWVPNIGDTAPKPAAVAPEQVAAPAPTAPIQDVNTAIPKHVTRTAKRVRANKELERQIAERKAAADELAQVRSDLERAGGQATQATTERKALTAEKTRIQGWIDKNATLGEKVEAAKSTLNPPAEVVQRQGESAADFAARQAEIARLEQSRRYAEELKVQAQLKANEPFAPAAAKMVKAGWYKTEDGFQIVRQQPGVWKVAAPEEFLPGDTIFGTLEGAKAEVARQQASPEYIARRQEMASRVPNYDQQIKNIDETLTELRAIEAKPTIEPTETAAERAAANKPREMADRSQPAPPPLPQRLTEIQENFHRLMRENTVEGQQARIAREWLPEIERTKQELSDVARQRGTAEEGVTLLEGREAMDMVGNLTGEQEQLGFQRMNLEAEQQNLPETLLERQGQYLQTLHSQEDARVANEAIIAKMGNQGVLAPEIVKNRAKLQRGSKQATATVTDLAAAQSGKMAAHDAQPLNDVLKQVDELIKANPLGKDKEMLRLQRLAEGYRDELAKLTTEVDLPAREVTQIEKAAKSGKLAPIVEATLQDGFKRMYKHGDVLVRSDIYDMFYKVTDGVQSKGFGRLMKLYTDFFKTYATLSPGFHVRNALSAIFMNFTEGVSTGTQMRGHSLWKEFANSETPITWLRGQHKDVQDAFRAVFASGSGGQFFEAGVGELSVGSRRLSEGIFQNRLTKGSQRIGQDWVEGPVRLGLAMHAIGQGDGARGALARITRVHFDYSQVSKFDEHAKRYIPFWTYMSRNMPLQITQMWTKPKLYQQFNSFKRNFSVENPEFMPEYIKQAGGFNTGLKTPDWLPGAAGGMPLLMQPDLPHTRLAEDIARFAQASSGENAGQLLSDFNPAFTAPAEFITGQDFFTGRQYKDSDISKVGIADLPMLPIAALLGELETGDGGLYISDKMRNTGRALVPPYDRIARLFPGAVGGSGGDRQFEAMARLWGAPIRTLSPDQQRGEAYRRQQALQNQRAVMAAVRG